MRRFFACLAAVVLAAFLVAALTKSEKVPPHPYLEGADFLVIAHRGGRHLGPESTLPLFRRAVELGVDVLEMDVRLSADSVLVVFHDGRVDHVTDGEGWIDSLTLAQIKSLDAGYAWSADGQTYPYRDQGLRIPTLEEIFSAFPGQRLLIEIKPDEERVARALCSSARAFAMENQVLVASFHGNALEAFRRACPQVATSASPGEVVTYWLVQRLGLESLYTPAFRALQVPRHVGPVALDAPGFVQGAKARGLPVHLWTINEEDDMERLLDLGISGIMTDRPDLLLALLRERGLR